jgi:hypothetical protein
VEAPTEEQEVQAYLGQMNNAQVECVGGKHIWAMDGWKIGRPIPDEVRFEPWSHDNYRVVDPCLNDCGAERTSLTNGNQLDPYAKPSYDYDQDKWVHVPAQYGRVSKGRMREEKIARGARHVAAKVAQAAGASGRPLPGQGPSVAGSA